MYDNSFDHEKHKLQVMKLICRKFTHEIFILRNHPNHLNLDHICMITVFIIKLLKYIENNLQKIYRQLSLFYKNMKPI